MNERIKELIVDAAIYAYQEEPTDYIAAELVKYERFSNLIIKECIDICESGNDTQMTCGGAAILIKQRFGVE